MTPRVAGFISICTCLSGRAACLLLCLLEVLTESLDVPVADDAGGETEEGFVDVVAAFPANA
jgi:hypothetical protein